MIEVLSNPYFYLAVIPVILIAGISKGGFAGGLGVISVPMIALVLPADMAAAIMLPILCLMDIFGVFAYRNQWNVDLLKILIPASFLGIIIGMLSFQHLHEANIRLITGLIAVIFSGIYFKNRFNLIKISKTSKAPIMVKMPKYISGGFWGGVAGFTSFIAHAGGPPVGVFLLQQKLDKTIFQATTVFFFTFVNFVKLIPYSMMGQFNGDILWISLILLPLAPIGIIIGIKLHHRVSPSLFYLICYSLLFFTGIKLIFDWLQYIL